MKLHATLYNLQTQITRNIDEPVLKRGLLCGIRAERDYLRLGNGASLWFVLYLEGTSFTASTDIFALIALTFECSGFLHPMHQHP
jgi:hypothetical protein